MADLASEQFLTEREERYLLKLVYRSANEIAGMLSSAHFTDNANSLGDVVS